MILLHYRVDIDLGDTSVREQNCARRELLNKRNIVRRHHHSTATLGNLLEDIHNTIRRANVEISRRLVGKNQTWLIHQSTCYGQALLLATRKLERHLITLMRETHEV